MKHSFNILAGVLLLLVATAIGSCRENTLISSKIAPTNENVFVFGDSLPIQAKTVYDDSVVTSLNYTGLAVYQAVGTMVDPYFGKTNASTIFQIVPSTLNFKFENFTVDSAVLVLPYAGYSWGDTNNTAAQQNLVVYRMNDVINLSTNYYPFSKTEVDYTKQYSAATPIKIPNLRDSVSFWGKKRAPHVRIRLNQSFINDITSAALSNFADYTTFVTWFKGLAVMAADTNTDGRAMPYFRLDGSDVYTQAGVVFYYHTPGLSDTLTQAFPFSSQYCAHYNRITRNYNGTPAQQYLNSGNYSDNIILLQNQPGAAIDVKIPNISHIPQAVINRAELVISVVQPDDIYAAPSKLFPMGIATNANGKDSTYYIADRYPISSTSPLVVMDGYKKKVDGVTTYKINIPRELQSAITQKRDTLHLRLIGTQDYYGATRLIAGGSTYNDPKLRIKFNVVLTKLN